MKAAVWEPHPDSRQQEWTAQIIDHRNTSSASLLRFISEQQCRFCLIHRRSKDGNPDRAGLER
jgi:hypothetical protein